MEERVAKKGSGGAAADCSAATWVVFGSSIFFLASLSNLRAFRI